MIPETKSFAQIELERAQYILKKLNKEDFSNIPEEYKKEPEKAKEFFEREVKHWEAMVGL